MVAPICRVDRTVPIARSLHLLVRTNALDMCSRELQSDGRTFDPVACVESMIWFRRIPGFAVATSMRAASRSVSGLAEEKFQLSLLGFFSTSIKRIINAARANASIIFNSKL